MDEPTFRQANGLSMQMAQTIGRFAMGEKQALNLVKHEVREELVKLIQPMGPAGSDLYAQNP